VLALVCLGDGAKVWVAAQPAAGAITFRAAEAAARASTVAFSASTVAFSAARTVAFSAAAEPIDEAASVSSSASVSAFRAAGAGPEPTGGAAIVVSFRRTEAGRKQLPCIAATQGRL
jgi:hypothetical protein